MPERADRAARKTWRTHLRDLQAFDKELAEVLSDAAREAERILRISLPTDAGIGAKAKRAQMQQALKAIRQLQADMYAGPITDAMLRSIETTTLHALEGLNTINAMGLRKNVAAAVRDSFEYRAKRAAENVRSRLINDIKLSNKVYKTRALSQRWVEREINRGLALGRSADEIARSVRAMIAPNTRGGVSYAAKRLGRTEINNAFHTSTIRMAGQQPWTEGFQWNLSGSHPRPDICNEYADDDHDGIGAGIFKPKSVPGKPHPQCLCYLTVVTVDEEEFMDKLLSGSYDKWLSRQSTR